MLTEPRPTHRPTRPNRVAIAIRTHLPKVRRISSYCLPRNVRNKTVAELQELREAGLVNHGSDGYAVTASGTDLLKRISDLQAFAGKWVVAQAKKK